MVSWASCIPLKNTYTLWHNKKTLKITKETYTETGCCLVVVCIDWKHSQSKISVTKFAKFYRSPSFFFFFGEMFERRKDTKKIELYYIKLKFRNCALIWIALELCLLICECSAIDSMTIKVVHNLVSIDAFEKTIKLNSMHNSRSMLEN